MQEKGLFMPLMIILFTLIPALELYLLFEIGGQIGGFNTIMIIILTGVLGATLAKSQGLSILMKIQNEMNTGALPGNQIIQGLMVFAGGLLLLTPGFMTDVVGFSLVLPGPRHLLLVWVKKLISHSMKSGNFKFQSFSGGNGAFYSYSSSQQTYSNNPFSQADEKQINQEVSPGVFEAEFHNKDK